MTGTSDSPAGGLVLTRAHGESIVIDAGSCQVWVTYAEQRGQNARIRINAPSFARVRRADADPVLLPKTRLLCNRRDLVRSTSAILQRVRAEGMDVDQFLRDAQPWRYQK